MTPFITLVAIYFSPSSFVVLAKAAQFTKAMGGQMHVLHVVESSFLSFSKNIDAITDKSFSVLQVQFPDIDAHHFHCVDGKLKTEVATIARVLHASMVIIGDSGESHLLGELIMGSHTKEVVRTSPVPVLVVKHEHALDYRNILIPTDLSDSSAVAVRRIAALFGEAKITLMHFFSLPFENRLGMYGMDGVDSSSYQATLRHEAQTKADAFMASLEIAHRDITIKVRKSSLSPKMFSHEVADIDTDLLVLHTTRNVSFYSFDLLEASPFDVVMLKV